MIPLVKVKALVMQNHTIGELLVYPLDQVELGCVQWVS